MQEEKINTCITCEHCNKGYCEHLGIYLDGYHWTCDNYEFVAGIKPQINASYAYVETIADTKRALDFWSGVVERATSVSAQTIAEKITGSPSGSCEDKVVDLLEAREQKADKQATFDMQMQHLCQQMDKKPVDDKTIINCYYINRNSAKSVSEKVGVSVRQFYRRCNDALLNLYDVLDQEYKRLAR